MPSVFRHALRVSIESCDVSSYLLHTLLAEAGCQVRWCAERFLLLGFGDAPERRVAHLCIRGDKDGHLCSAGNQGGGESCEERNDNRHTNQIDFLVCVSA